MRYRDGDSSSAGYRTVGFVIRMSAYKTVNKRADPKRNFGSSLGLQRRGSWPWIENRGTKGIVDGARGGERGNERRKKVKIKRKRERERVDRTKWRKVASGAKGWNESG